MQRVFIGKVCNLDDTDGDRSVYGIYDVESKNPYLDPSIVCICMQEASSDLHQRLTNKATEKVCGRLRQYTQTVPCSPLVRR